MRIGLDVRYLSHGLVGGIHTYLVNFIPALIDAASDHQLVLYADTKRPFELSALPGHVETRLLPYHGPVSNAWLDFTMKNQMARDHLDVAHFTASYGFGPASARTVITLQDEINILPLKEIYRGHSKDQRTLIMMTYLHLCTHAGLKKADAVVTVSEYSKRQIVRYSSLDPDRIVVIPHACPRDIQRIEDVETLDDVRRRLDLTRPFILAEAFKNPGVIYRAWQRLPADLRESHQIIFFSRSPDVLPVVHEAVESGFARLLIRPARRDLSALFSLCQAFVFPSWIEGFGIPLIEAMTCGAPIVASDRGSIPEVVQDAAWLMDAEDDSLLAVYLERLLTQPALREGLRKAGYERVKHFSWPKIAGQVLDLYQQVAEAGFQKIRTI